MADEILVAMYYFPLKSKICLLHLTIMQFKKKLVLWYVLTIILVSMVLWLYLSKFSKTIYQKMKFSKNFKCSLLVKHSKLWWLGFTNLQFQEKLGRAVHFDFSFSKLWFFGIIYQNFQTYLFQKEVSNSFKK